MSQTAAGSFEVKNSPLAPDEALAGTTIGRFALDKQYTGDLVATAKGEMLGCGNPAGGNAGYVAIEQVTGTLAGRTGGFSLQHIGTMRDGNFELTVVTVPGSGTGELDGIIGTMAFTLAQGAHAYTFDYTLQDMK